MSEITKAHIEWAAVSRLALMLENPHPKFNVTHTYAFLTSIVCWVVQRVRSMDKDVEPLHKTLGEEFVTNAPWNILDAHLVKFVPGTVRSLTDLSALEFVIGLRNAIAHGDARRVRPINSEPDLMDRCLLTGFSFCCESTKGKQLIWRGKANLLERDMRRIGLELAERFCNLWPQKPHFREIASQRVLEHA